MKEKNLEVYKNHPKVKVVDHPLVQHKLSLLRDKNASSKSFRELINEIALFEGYEASRNLKLEDVEIETPLAKMTAKQLSGKKVLIVPIIRAGLAFVEPLLLLIPAARVGHLGMYRDEETHKPIVYFDKMPHDAAERDVIIVDPMLATGGSINMAINYMRNIGVKNTITIMVLVAVPEGIEAVFENDDNVTIVTAAIDDGLNENAFIVPGLGDAGDRIFGTK